MQDAIIIAISLGLLTFLGFVSNWAVVIVSRKLTTSKHAFGILTVNQAIVDAIFSTIFLFYICPMIISNNEFLLKYVYYIGYWLLVCYELCIQFHFLISCNRFCAVFFPIKYARIFSVTNTYIMVAALCIISLTAAFIAFYVGCPLSWWGETFEFDLPPTDYCAFIGLDTQMPRYLFCIATVIILDILTVFRVRQFTERLQATTATVDKKDSSSKRREMSFLKQTCTQGAVCSWELIACFYLSPMTENLWLLFFFNSISWAAVHTFDGIATLTFNQDMNKYLKGLIFKKNKIEEASRTRNSEAIFKVSTTSRVVFI